MRQDRGAAVVEFALIVPLFFMLVMGMITGGVAFDRKNTLSHSSREATRFGATLAIEDTTGVPNAWLDSIATNAITSAAGQLVPGVRGPYICVAYVGFKPQGSSSADWTRTRVETGSGVTYTNGSVSTPSSWCYDDGRGSDGKQRRVQVVVGLETTLNAVLFSTNLDLRSEAVGRFEAVAG